MGGGEGVVPPFFRSLLGFPYSEAITRFGVYMATDFHKKCTKNFDMMCSYGNI